MKTASKVIASLGAALTLGSVQASPINIGGVIWDPDSLFDFSATDQMIETIVDPVVGAKIQGYAKVNNINGTGEATFCPGCEVTYEFFDYEISAISGTGEFTWTGGKINIYVDNTPDFDQTLASTAGDGVLFLALEGAAHVDGSTGQLGTLHSDPTPNVAGVSGDGRGFLNVVGGLAANNFDTDLFPIMTDLMGGMGTADFLFTSSFQLIPNGSGGSTTFVSDDGVTYGLFGSNDLSGGSIPEPAPIALASLALLGLGLGQRRRRRS